MWKLIVSITFLVLSLVVQYGDAGAAKCPVSPDNTIIYFDLEQLDQMALEQGYNDKIHSPVLCEGGNDIECSTQQCCGDEVGCCYSDPNTNVRKCGCKQLGSKTCTYPAPLVVLAKSECDTEKIAETSVCLGANRLDEENHVSTKTTRNTTLQTFADSKDLMLLALAIIILSKLQGRELDKGLSSSEGLSDQKHKCLMPGITSLIYLDLEQLSLLALQQGSIGLIQSPRTCVEGNGSDCSKQQCCHGEVGCCYTDNRNNKHIRKCGCKKVEDKKCTYPAPLGILAHSECGSEEIRNATACLRERRWNEETFIPSPLQPATNPQGFFDKLHSLIVAISSVLA